MREATVFWHVSEHPEQINNAASSAGLIGANGSLGTPAVNGRFRVRQNEARMAGFGA